MIYNYQLLYQKIIDKSWFQEYGIINPDIAFEKWSTWINDPKRRSLKEEKYYCKVCELAIDNEHVKRFYFTDNPDYIRRFGESLKRVLDRMVFALIELLPKESQLKLPEHRKHKGTIRDTFNSIALVTQFTDLVSFPYYLNVFEQITAAARKYNFSVSIHNAPEQDLFHPIDKIIHTFRPSGIILIRRAPDKATISNLNRENVPLMLINADDREYDGAVIGNIIPVYPRKTETKFIDWLKAAMREKTKESNHKVVIAAMQPRTPADNHRGDRIEFMKLAVLKAGLTPVIEYVSNYGFQNALPIYQQHPDAFLFVSLSDQIAVSLKNMLTVRQQNYKYRIVGFDNSNLSINEAIPSFGQNMKAFGELVISRFVQAFEQKKGSSEYQYTFEKIPVEVLFYDRGSGK